MEGEVGKYHVNCPKACFKEETVYLYIEHIFSKNSDYSLILSEVVKYIICLKRLPYKRKKIFSPHDQVTSGIS